MDFGFTEELNAGIVTYTKKWTILHLEHSWGAHLPYLGREPVGG